MAEILSTESGALNRYIDFGTPDELTNLANTATGITVIAYLKPGTQGNTNYIFAKCNSSGVGLRLALNISRQISFSPYSVAGAINPAVVGSTSVPTDSWSHIQVTATGNGSVAWSQIEVFLNAGDEDTYTYFQDGSGSISSDAANSVYILNRPGLGRGFIGDLGYVAVWGRVLNSTERATVRSEGPLEVSDGLVFCFANDQDYSTNALTYVGRSTRVEGSAPTNIALGELPTGSTIYTITPSGSVTLEGTNEANRYHTVIPTGNVSFSGNVVENHIHSIFPTGSINFTNSEIEFIEERIYIPTGNISFSGSAPLYIPGMAVESTKLPLTGVGS